MMSDGNLSKNELVLYLHSSAAFQLLHAGVELNVFELIRDNPSINLNSIMNSSGLKQESARSLVFGLTSMGLLSKNGDFYKNCNAIEELFSNNEWPLFRSMVEVQAHIMYLGQIDFVESLKKNTNVGVKRFDGHGKTIYEKLSRDTKLRGIFYKYMGNYSEYAIPFLLEKVDFSADKKILDVGGGDGANAIALAKQYPNAEIILLDLPAAGKIAKQKIRKENLSKTISFAAGNMFKNKFPNRQDSVLFIHQLVIWSPWQNELLLKKAFNSLKEGGRAIIFSSMADDNEDGPLMAGLDTVYFRAIAAGHGMIYPYKDYEELLRKAGFKKTERIKCNTWTPHGIVIGIK